MTCFHGTSFIKKNQPNLTYNKQVRSEIVRKKRLKNAFGWRKALSEKTGENEKKYVDVLLEKTCLRHARMHPYLANYYSTCLYRHLARMRWNFLLTHFWQLYKEKEEKKNGFDSREIKVTYLSDFGVFGDHFSHWKAISSVFLHVLRIYTYGF